MWIKKTHFKLSTENRSFYQQYTQPFIQKVKKKMINNQQIHVIHIFSSMEKLYCEYKSFYQILSQVSNLSTKNIELYFCG